MAIRLSSLLTARAYEQRHGSIVVSCRSGMPAKGYVSIKCDHAVAFEANQEIRQPVSVVDGRRMRHPARPAGRQHVVADMATRRLTNVADYVT
jgi:hypothetical protein